MNLQVNSSHILSKKDNELVNSMLGGDRISICTVYVQLYVVSNSANEWGLLGIGPLCLTHDFHLNAFILTLIDANCQRVVWESELTHSMDFMWVSEKFHILQLDQMMGINFICHLEAQHFQYRMSNIKSYIKITQLDLKTRNSQIKQNQKKNGKNFNLSTSLKSYTPSNSTNKLTRPKSPIVRGKLCIKRCYQKLRQNNNSYQRFENSKNSLPEDEMSCEIEESVYQTLSEVRQIQIRKRLL